MEAVEDFIRAVLIYGSVAWALYQWWRGFPIGAGKWLTYLVLQMACCMWAFGSTESLVGKSVLAACIVLLIWATILFWRREIVPALALWQQVLESDRTRVDEPEWRNES